MGRAGIVSERVTRAFRALLRLRLARFLAVGASGAMVKLVWLSLLAGLVGVREDLASAAAFGVALVWSFLLDNAITFRDRNTYARADVGERLLRYNLVGLGALAVRLWISAVGGSWRGAAPLLAIAAGTAFGYLANLHFTWRQAPEAERSAARRPLVPRAAQG